MNERVINDFMFALSVKYKTKHNKDTINNIVNELNNQYLVQDLNKLRKDVQYKTIYVSNKNNSMSGYYEKWTANCKHCNIVK